MFKKFIKQLKKGLIKFYNHRLQIILGAIILFIILNIVHYNMNQSRVEVRISLNYSQASKGLNPNSTRFSVYEFTCDEVLEKTIEYAGLTGKITPEELKAAINIVPGDRTAIQSMDEYVCTTYCISYTNPKQIKGIDSLNMLEIYCSAYKEYFIENYGDNSAILYYDSDSFNHTESYLKLKDTELKAKQISRYVEQRIKENTSYTDPETGENFLSVMKEINQVMDYDIPNIHGFILESGVSENKADLLATLKYKNKISKVDYDIMMARYDSDNGGMRIYDEAMSGIVLVPAVDANDKYYMSRTETALDDMANGARESLKIANEIQKNITETNHTVVQMEQIETTDENLRKAADMIAELDSRIDSISKKLKALDSSYIRYKTHNYLTFKYNAATFLQSIDMSLTAIEIMLYLILCYIVAVVCTYREKDNNTIRRRDDYEEI